MTRDDEHKVMVLDAATLARHRPGFRYASDQQRAASDRAYALMVAEAERAWMTPAQREQQIERDCIAARDEVLSMGDVEQIRSRAYERMCEEARNAWKARP